MAKEKKKKGGFGKFLFVLILLVIIALAILYFFGDGLGLGKGNGEEDTVPVNATVSETTESTETSTVRETVFVDVNIDGEEYLYQNQSYSLDEFMAEISKIEGEFEVHISLSDTATLAARENLEARLDEESILHNIVEKAE
ncbi:MAG: hypothetical protein K2G04_09110 [Oscillospiraceae bacterium]|nr:hypothetical protein [Oscillospiraceae bacterium]